jgi:hypothetical protein
MEVVYSGPVSGLSDYFIPREDSGINLTLASTVTCHFELQYTISPSTVEGSDQSVILAAATGPWIPETLQRLLPENSDTLLETQVTLKASLCEDPENVVKTIYYCLLLFPIYEDLKQIRRQLNTLDDGPFKYELQRQSQLDIVEKYFEKRGWSHAYSTFLKILPEDQAVDPTEKLYEIIDYITERRRNIGSRVGVVSIYTTSQKQLLRSLTSHDNSRDIDEILFFMSFSYGYHADFSSVIPPIMVYFTDIYLDLITNYLDLVYPKKTIFGSGEGTEVDINSMIKHVAESYTIMDEPSSDKIKKITERFPNMKYDRNKTFGDNLGNIVEWHGQILEITLSLEKEEAARESDNPEKLVAVSETIDKINWVKDFAKISCQVIESMYNSKEDSLTKLDSSIIIEEQADDLLNDI